MNEILLSIIIPTRNREEYLFEVIKNILSIKDDRFELVIQNNSDTNDLQIKLTEFNFINDDRLKYHYCDKTLSFVDNFSKGISNSQGEYLIFIGDDDTINPNIINIAEWAFSNKIDAITPSLPFVYFWPQTGFDEKIETGRLTISKYQGSVRFYNPQEQLKKLLNNGAQNYLSYNLVKAYHGLVKSSYFRKIKDSTGYYIGGLSPDIYLSVGLSLLIEKVMVIDYPLTISGICNKSGSADSATGRHTGNLEDAPHFKGHTEYFWSKQIPKFYSVETIWGDSALHAVNDINPLFLKYFNLDVICALCLYKYGDFRKEVYESLSNNYTNISQYSIIFKWHLFCGFLFGPFKSTIYHICNRVYNRIFNRKKLKMYYKIADINIAMEIVNNDLNENKYILNKIKSR